MKRFLVAVVLCLMFSVCMSAPKAMAFGMGLYANSGMGSADYDVEDEAGTTWELEADIERNGFGFVLDSAVANDRVFNYRLNIGPYEWREDIDGGMEFDLRGIMMSHDFGFGVLRNKYVRLWLGPELRFAYGIGEDVNMDEFEVGLFSASIGPVLGINIHLGSVVSLGIKSGYLYESFFGWGDNDTTDYSQDYHGSSTQFFVTLNVIFRINDVF